MKKSTLSLISILVSPLLVACGNNTEPLQELEKSSFVEPQAYIEIEVLDYKPRQGMVLEHLFVSNFSVNTRRGKLSYSSSRDGLSDTRKIQLEPQYGFFAPFSESVVTGFSDLAIYLSGILLSQQPFLYCSNTQMQNTSNDGLLYTDRRLINQAQQFLGLRDCEKNYLDLDRFSFDTDGDGIPDYLELRCGLNPLNPYDAMANPAGDGVSNIDKCKKNIPIDEDAYSPANQTLAYRYNFERQPDGSKTLNISNIPVLNNGKDNFIAFYIVERSPTTQESRLVSAYMIIPDESYANQLIEIDYWAHDPQFQFNQEVLLQ